MLCKLNEFAFESHNVNLSTVKRQTSYQYANQQMINGFDEWQSVGRYSQTISLSGTLIQQDNGALNSLYALAEKKEPVSLSLPEGKALTVLIKEISADQSLFLKSGKFCKQNFDIQLVVTHGNL